MTEQHETSFPRRAFLRLALAVQGHFYLVHAEHLDQRSDRLAGHRVFRLV